MHSKFLGMLGLCARAGKIVSGEDAVRLAVKKSQAHMVILDALSSENTRERISGMCERAKISLLTVDLDVGKAIGKEGRRILAVTDAKFAKILEELYNNPAGLAEQYHKQTRTDT